MRRILLPYMLIPFLGGLSAGICLSRFLFDVPMTPPAIFTCMGALAASFTIATFTVGRRNDHRRTYQARRRIW